MARYSFDVPGRKGSLLASSRSKSLLLARTISLFYIGWILNSLNTNTCEVFAAPVIDPHQQRDIWNHSNINRAHLYNNTNNNGNATTAADSRFGGDTIETESSGTVHKASDIVEVDVNKGHGSPPQLVLPDFLLQTTDEGADDKVGDAPAGVAAVNHDGNKNGDITKHEDDSTLQQQQLTMGEDNNGDGEGKTISEIEYQPGFVLHCAAKGYPRPNLTFTLDGEHLPLYVTMTGLKYSYPLKKADSDDNDNKNNHNQMDDDKEEENTTDDSNGEHWVDLRLPMLNNAFYGRLRCQAENEFGAEGWEIELIHNANSSVFMKLVRIVLSITLIVLAIMLIKLTWWLNVKHQQRLYEKLPPQDLEIINKFKTGLGPPPPSPSSSIVQTNAMGLGASCVVGGIEISVTEDGGVGDADILKEGYRLVKEQSSSPDLQRRLASGSTTPTSCKSMHVLDLVNSWTNYVPYDDKFEMSSQHFKVDFSNMIENGSYGIVYTGSIRNDLTMEWSSVAVKSGKTERDDNFLLESILTELKILASLPKPHFSIVNLRGAYTKMLYKRQAYIFVDFCENGNLANFIDLNRKYFQVPGSRQDLNTLPALNPSNNNAADGLLMKPVSVSKEGGVNDKETASNSNNASLPSSKDNANEVSITIEKANYDDGKRPQTFGLKELLTWSWQIADGMYFLHKNRVIHGNLSPANVFLTAGLSAKVGNIGLTPSEESSQCIDETTKKWLTVPSFGYEQFSKKSDVWDFGRVLWEIFSLREQQIPDRETIRHFLRTEDEDDDGEIEVPDYATSEVFELMLCCWDENGTLCPEFDFLTRAFRQILKTTFVSTQAIESAPAANNTNEASSSTSTSK